MDPDKALANIRELADDLSNRAVNLNDNDDVEGYLNDVFELTDRIHALDEWIMRGGFLPKDWSK